MQSEDGDLLAVNHRIKNPSFRNLKRDAGRYKATDKATAPASPDFRRFNAPLRQGIVEANRKSVLKD